MTARGRAWAMIASAMLGAALVTCVPDMPAEAPPTSAPASASAPRPMASSEPPPVPAVAVPLCDVAGEVWTVDLDLRSVQLPSAVTGTACRNERCMTFSFKEASLKNTPNGYMIANSEDGSTFNLEFAREPPRGTRVTFFLRPYPHPKDGDVYSLKLEGPPGKVLIDVSTPVTYRPQDSDPCTAPDFDAVVVID